MHQAIATLLRKSARLFTGNGNPGAPAAANRTAALFSTLLGRRSDDLFVIAIGVLLALLFIAQVGWQLLNRSHP